MRRVRPDGQEGLDQVPLTLEDLLHPQEDDVVTERRSHGMGRRHLANIFSGRRPPAAGYLVLADCLVNRGVPGAARQTAEAQAQREAEARQAAEARLQELEAELRRLRGEEPR